MNRSILKLPRLGDSCVLSNIFFFILRSFLDMSLLLLLYICTCFGLICFIQDHVHFRRFSVLLNISIYV